MGGANISIFSECFFWKEELGNDSTALVLFPCRFFCFGVFWCFFFFFLKSMLMRFLLLLHQFHCSSGMLLSCEIVPMEREKRGGV